MQVTGLDHRFGGLHALRDCSFTIEQGRITCLVGRTAPGKTTIFNVITGFLQPDEGSVAFRDRTLDGLRPQAIVHAGIARTFQNLRLFADLTALDNVMVGIAGQVRRGTDRRDIPPAAHRTRAEAAAAGSDRHPRACRSGRSRA